eukprot:XP_025000028.1 hydroxysteroid 11-beta-dehydrogenase 1-like protein isoform X2 [Gallus gallus]
MIASGSSLLKVSVPQRLHLHSLSSFLFPFCTARRMMKPFGKVLCAAGSLAVLLAFFWRDTFQPEQLSGARVLLTGASAGIGEQMAYHYATFGAEIVLTARREAVLQEVMKKCLTLGAKKVFYIPADMSSPSEPDRVVQFAVQNLGGLDYLVLNHIGVSPFQMWGGDVEHTRWLMQVNFFSYVALATAALPTLEKNHGSVVVVSSLTGQCVTEVQLLHTSAQSRHTFELQRAGRRRAGLLPCRTFGRPPFLPQGRYPPPSPPPTQPRSSHWTASSAPCATSSRCRRGTSPSRCASSASSTPTRRWRRPEAKCSSPPLRRQKRLSPSSAAVPRGCGSSSTRGGCSPCTACGCCSPTPACCRASTTTAARDGAPRDRLARAERRWKKRRRRRRAAVRTAPHRTARDPVGFPSPSHPPPPRSAAVGPFSFCFSFRSKGDEV